MDMEFLGDSTCVKAAGFSHGYLTIEFQDGSIYTYEGVDASTWRSMKRSVSKGWFFNKNIRNNYSFMEGTAPEEGDLKWIDQGHLDAIDEAMGMFED